MRAVEAVFHADFRLHGGVLVLKITYLLVVVAIDVKTVAMSAQALVEVGVWISVAAGVQTSVEVGAKATGGGAGGSLLSRQEAAVADGSGGRAAARAAVAAYDLDSHWVAGN